MDESPPDWLQQTPPWRAFPRMQPMQLAATQGAGELWFDQVWRPFWLGLGDDQRARYHAHWQTTPSWREAIDFFCQPPPSAPELAQDAAESEAHLRAWRDAAGSRAAPQPSLLTRVAAWWRQR